MPEIRERDPNDFIKSKGKGKYRFKKSGIAPRIDNAIRGKVREHRGKKEESNEYAVGVTEEAAAEVAIEARHIPGDIKRTVQNLQPKTKERVLNDPEQRADGPEAIEPEETGHAPDPIEQQQRKLAAKKAQEKADTPPPEDPPQPIDSYPNDPPEPEYSEMPPYTQRHDPTPPAETPKEGCAPKQGNNPGGSKPDIKEKPKGSTAPKQRPEQELKTRSRVEQSAHKTNRPAKQAQNTQQSAAKKATEQGRKKFKREAQKQTAENAKKAAKKTAETAKKAGEAVVRAAKSVVEMIVAAFGGVGLVAILAVIVVIGVIAASPLGIFFSSESTPNSVPLSSAVSQINMELNTRLISLQSGDYTDIIVEGAPPSWTDVIAVFASYTAGTENGVDVAQLTPDRVSRLQSVFWQMCYITSSTETVTIPDSDPDDEIDDSRTETTLTITITGKTADEMRSVYGFTDFQNETLDILLSDTAALNSLIGNMSICQQDALELLRSLPSDLSPERRAVVQQALMLVGKVNYFWGGKSLVIGWDSRWGQLTKVTAEGSPTTGTYRPYGLDCSGFADWVFYNASGGEYILGHGGGVATQHRYCEQIGWGEAQPGDLVFYPDDSHIGIVGLRDVTGNLLIIHCASGSNNVVITDSSGFMLVGRPLYYGE